MPPLQMELANPLWTKRGTLPNWLCHCDMVKPTRQFCLPQTRLGRHMDSSCTPTENWIAITAHGLLLQLCCTNSSSQISKKQMKIYESRPKHLLIEYPRLLKHWSPC